MSLAEERIDLSCEGQGDVPCSIWSATREPRGVVLLGHGLGVDRYDGTVRRPVEVLTAGHGAVVVVPELPLHGERGKPSSDPSGIVDRWQAFWVSGGVEAICRELESVVRFCERSFQSLPLVYFGLSLGTQYGIPFLARTPAIRAAALGLFGSRPPPATPVMNRCAPEVRCPVYFIQKTEDEIHPAESTTHLFSTLGSADKVLDSSSGKHTETSMESLRKACAFLDSHGGFRER